MFSESAELYDAIYSTFKDYDAGLVTSHDPKGLTDRGLYVAQARP